MSADELREPGRRVEDAFNASTGHRQGADDDIEQALERARVARAAYGDMRDWILAPGATGPDESDRVRIRALRHEVDAAEAEVARMKRERGHQSPGSAGDDVGG